jgi:cell division transport system permease protein
MAEGWNCMTDAEQPDEMDYRRERPKKWYVRSTEAQAAIVPEGSISSTALVFVIAIMTFLACLTLGAVMVVRETASSWQLQIAREATIQIKPEEGFDMEGALTSVQALASGFPGVRSAGIIDKEATARLLEPWLGSDLNIDTLPVPRLVIVTIDPVSPPDFAALKIAISKVVPRATLEDHRNWVDRLVAMARTTVVIGLAVLGLVLSATALTVIFATRGAMAGNGDIIEVLHFVGAESRFIAREFRQRFFLTGIKGALGGGLIAIVVFLSVGWWSSSNIATPEADQTNALFGSFSIGWAGYAGVLGIVALVALITAETTRFTVIRHLKGLDRSNPA